MDKNKNLIIKETFGRAIKNHQEGKTAIAQDLYNQVLKIDPNYADALNNLGLLFKKTIKNPICLGSYLIIALDMGLLN